MRIKMLIMIGEYYPYSSANGKIAYELVTELKNDYDISILTRRTHFHLQRKECFEGTKIYRVNDFNMMFQNYLSSKRLDNHKCKICGFFWLVLIYLVKIFFFARRFLRATSIDKIYSRKLTRKMALIHKNEQFNVVFSMSSPHEEIYAGYLFKKKESSVKFYIYQMDRFSNGESLYPLKRLKGFRYRNNLNLEKIIYKTSDLYLILKPLRRFFCENIADETRPNVIVTEHPLLKDRSSNWEKFYETKHFQVTYAGSLDLALRNPMYYLQMITENLDLLHNLRTDIYAFGNCGSILTKYSKLAPENIHVLNRVDSNSIATILSKSQFLLIIGNKNSEEMPSKLFEYIGYCRPIIYLYSDDRDKYLEYLSLYPIYIALKMSKELMRSNASRLEKFCVDYSQTRISYEQVEKYFINCTPKHLCTLIKSKIERNQN